MKHICILCVVSPFLAAQALLYNEDLSETCTTALLRTGRALQTGKMWAVKSELEKITSNVYKIAS